MFTQGRYHHNHHQVDGVLVNGSQTHLYRNSVDQLPKSLAKKAVDVKNVPSSIIHVSSLIMCDSLMHFISERKMLVFVMVSKLRL